MTPILLRRRKLGRTSCREISRQCQTGIRHIRNWCDPLPATELVFRWGCTSNVPTPNVVNTAEAIHLVSNKLAFRRILNEHELCPRTWFSLESFRTQPDPITYPVIVRRATHHQGRFLDVVTSGEDLRAACAKYGTGNFYISEFINKVAEYRVFVVQGRVAAVAKKTPGNPQDVAWNVAQGGRFDNMRFDEWPLKAVRISIEAFNLSGLDFGGVDVMVDAENNCYVLEINSAPSLTSPYRQQCMAKCFDWIVRNGKAPIPLIEKRGGWKKFIHPAISEEAQLV